MKRRNKITTEEAIYILKQEGCQRECGNVCDDKDNVCSRLCAYGLAIKSIRKVNEVETILLEGEATDTGCRITVERLKELLR